MAGTPFDYYGESASKFGNFSEVAGRYSFQREAEQYLLLYLLEKLSLSPEDDLLDIGCGAGNLLIPLSFFIRSTTGIDHPNLLTQIKNRLPKDTDTITLLPGEFLTTEVPGTFSRILIYGVIHNLRDEEEVLRFIRKAAILLRPGGKMLIGDIPNIDIKARFLSSERGKKFIVQWQEQVERERKVNPEVNLPFTTTPLVTIGDAFADKMIAALEESHLRAKRFPQPETLAFGFTREDILAEKE